MPLPDQTFDGSEQLTRIGKPIVGIRPRAARAHLLDQFKGPGAPKRFVLDRDGMVMGRLSTVELYVASEEVSRQHARLTRTDDEFTIEDLGSRNGIYLNGLKVHSAVLREGDEVQMGDCLFTYHEGA
jgi:pSer/pThr/pTyr-binding forkhead associated (FHA) protein